VNGSHLEPLQSTFRRLLAAKDTATLRPKD
jgi:hypothetical protein